MSEKISVNVASYQRIDSLILTLKSLINQCDEINVALNNHYTEEIPDFLYHEKINLFFTDNKLGDAYKFLNLNSTDGYYLSIDDDLIYPPSYVSDTIKRCKEFNNKKVITYHGRNFPTFPIISYYRSATERYTCLNKVHDDVKVQFGGTGVMCFHTNLFKIPIDYFEHANMADVWVGKYCVENNIDILCVKHEAGYIKYTPQTTTIFDNESKSDSLQTRIVNEIFKPKTITSNSTEENKVFKEKVKSIELSKKQLNYEKINQIFQSNNPKIIKQNRPNQENVNLTSNSSTISKVMGKNKKKFK